MLTAKPVINNRYWIVQKNGSKVGTIEATPTNGFIVKVGDQVDSYSNIKSIETRTAIQFDKPANVKSPAPNTLVNGFPADGIAYNAVYDLQNRIPMYTKTKKSKSWYAAGYYRIKLDKEWETVFCPKLILLQRYEYFGPVRNEADFTFR